MRTVALALLGSAAAQVSPLPGGRCGGKEYERVHQPSTGDRSRVLTHAATNVPIVRRNARTRSPRRLPSASSTSPRALSSRSTTSRWPWTSRRLWLRCAASLWSQAQTPRRVDVCRAGAGEHTRTLSLRLAVTCNDLDAGDRGPN
eukprot:COSAG02_NODE_1446_length_12578_cov_3.488661_4_plen_145_part_00